MNKYPSGVGSCQGLFVHRTQNIVGPGQRWVYLKTLGKRGTCLGWDIRGQEVGFVSGMVSGSPRCWPSLSAFETRMSARMGHDGNVGPWVMWNTLGGAEGGWASQVSGAQWEEGGRYVNPAFYCGPFVHFCLWVLLFSIVSWIHETYWETRV